MAARGPKSDKIWADAVRRAVMRRLENEEGKPQKIERLADNLVEMGLAGDVTAIKEIGDRLDGKPKAQTEVSGPDGGPIQTEETGAGAAKLQAVLDVISSRTSGETE